MAKIQIKVKRRGLYMIKTPCIVNPEDLPDNFDSNLRLEKLIEFIEQNNFASKIIVIAHACADDRLAAFMLYYADILQKKFSSIGCKFSYNAAPGGLILLKNEKYKGTTFQTVKATELEVLIKKAEYFLVIDIVHEDCRAYDNVLSLKEIVTESVVSLPLELENMGGDKFLGMETIAITMKGDSPRNIIEIGGFTKKENIRK